MKRLFILCLAALVLASCKTTGPSDNRLSYRWQWLSYLAGDDIRELCEKGSQDRLRLIYNADFNKETRTWDFTAAPGGATDLVAQRWVSASTLRLSDGYIGGALDPQTSRVHIPGEDMADLVAALDDSGFYGPPPLGALLRSDDYFWSGVACLDGRFHVQAYPRDRLDDVRFSDAITQLDQFEYDLPPVVLKSLPPLNAVRNAGRPDRSGDLYYAVDVGENTFVGWWLN